MSCHLLQSILGPVRDVFGHCGWLFSDFSHQFGHDACNELAGFSAPVTCINDYSIFDSSGHPLSFCTVATLRPRSNQILTRLRHANDFPGVCSRASHSSSVRWFSICSCRFSRVAYAIKAGISLYGLLLQLNNLKKLNHSS